MSKSKTELIIDSFEKMNLSMLEVLLDEDKTYQEATKDVFLDKIKESFSTLKDRGDTNLQAYKGFCNSTECPNRGCKGYSFVGNNSKNHIDLIFDEVNDDVNDIYNCSALEIYDKSVQRESFINITIMHDEEADFEPGVDYLIKSQKCNSAYEELYQYQDIIINKEIFLPWLEKYHALYKSFDLPPIFDTQFKKFHWLYYLMNDLKEFLESDEAAKKAVAEFESLERDNETQLLSWLVKFEKTGHDLTLFMFEDMDYENPEAKPYFLVHDFKISTSDFKYLAKFKYLFDEYYWTMLEKYSTFTEEEKNQYISQNSEMADYISSLSYHLKRSGI